MPSEYKYYIDSISIIHKQEFVFGWHSTQDSYVLKGNPHTNSLLLFAGFWHPARGICMNLQKQWKCFNGGSEVRCMTNDSVINDTSLKTIVDSENFVAIILDDLK